jgi:hypothetical protein
MPRKKHTPEQIITKLRLVNNLCRQRQTGYANCPGSTLYHSTVLSTRFPFCFGH